MIDMLLLIDGDSIAYMAGNVENAESCGDYIDELITNLRANTGIDRYELYIEEPHLAKNIYRNHVAVTQPYKAGRSSKKPKYLALAKQHMIDRWGAICSRYVEAEDMVSIRAYRLGLDKVMIAAIDKDLLQIPTTFINYRKWTCKTVTPEEAIYNFYRQVLTGDVTDNIPGLRGVGPKTADKIIINALTDQPPKPLGAGTHYELLLAKGVAKEYVRRGHTYEYLLEQCRLLYLLHHHGDVFHYPLSKEIYLTL